MYYVNQLDVEFSLDPAFWIFLFEDVFLGDTSFIFMTLEGQFHLPPMFKVWAEFVW